MEFLTVNGCLHHIKAIPEATAWIAVNCMTNMRNISFCSPDVLFLNREIIGCYFRCNVFNLLFKKVIISLLQQLLHAIIVKIMIIRGKMWTQDSISHVLFVTKMGGGSICE